MNPQYIVFLTPEELATLTVEQLGALQIEPSTTVLSLYDTEELLRPLMEPSGIWADYNRVYAWYQMLLGFQRVGILDQNLRLDPPAIADYTDLTTPRSARWY